MSIKNANYYFLEGGGEMGELIRAKDWSKTSLGNTATWPQSLCTIVSVMLNNPFAMYIAWGDDSIQLYNDGYCPILGANKHPQALGISTSETFSEVWDIVGPMFADVMKGKAVGFPDFMLPLNRNGFVEECFFDFSYAPIRKDDGEVGGILVTVIETTTKKKSEQALTAALQFTQLQQRLYNSVTNNTPDLVYVFNPAYRFTYANKALLNMLLKTEEDVIGNGLRENGYEELHASTHEREIDEVVATKKPIRGTIAFGHAKSGKRLYDYIFAPVFNDKGEVEAIAGTSRDITEIKLSEDAIKESEAQLAFAIDAAELGVWDYNPTTNKFTANDRMRSWFGFGQDEAFDFTLGMAVVAEADRQRVADAFEKAAIWGGGDYDIEYTIVQPDTGQKRIVLAKGKATFNEDRIAYRFNGTLQDITAEALASKQIEESEQRFKNLVRDVTAAIVVLTGPEMKVQIVNEAYGRLINFKPHQMLGKPLFSLVPDLEEEYLPILENVRQTGEILRLYDSPYAVTVSNKRIEGYLHIEYQPYRDTDGNIVGVMAIMQDVTEAVLARKKIEQSEKKFEAAILAVQGIIWTNNANGEMIGEQPGWANLTGQSFEEYQGYGWAKAVHPDDAKPTVEAWNNAVANRSTFEFEHRVKTKQDGWKLFSVKAVPVFDENTVIEQWVGVHTDITEQNIAEQKLAYRTALLEAHNEANVDGILLVDAKGKILSFNQRFIEIWNMPQHIVKAKDDEAALSFAMAQLVNPQQFIDKVKYLYEHPTETSLDELEFKNGKIVERNGYPVIGENLNYYAWSWTFKDITSQKNHEKTIIESEKRFRLLADSMPQHIWTSDAEGNLNYYNHSVFSYSGLTLEQINKDGWLQIVHPDDREANIKAWTNAVTTGKDFLFEHRFRRHDGEYRWQLSRAIAQKNENGKIKMWVGTSTDIQDQKTFTNELESQVRKRTRELADTNIELEKMNKELQSFAYISSHDLQEPLRKIQIFSTHIMEKEAQNLSDSGKDKFMRMHNAAQRMQTLINDLLDYSRTNSQERNFETINLSTIIEEVKEDLKEELKEKHATLEVFQLCEAKIIPFQFRQLMHNLIGNALKFSHPTQPPHVIIKSEIANGKHFNNVNLSPQKNYCHISVSDNGIGFEQEYNEKIFEVFQRLHGQHVYKGTGIGLSIVKKIVENHEGIITAYGELNKGATFNIYIPAT